MKLYWAFIAGADLVGMVFAIGNNSGAGFVCLGASFMLALYFLLIHETN